MTWARWFGNTSERIVAQWHFGSLFVSTIFEGIDKNYFDDGAPILFETMVFDSAKGEWDMYQERYSTWEEAEAGHMVVCKRIREKLNAD